MRSRTLRCRARQASRSTRSTPLQARGTRAVRGIARDELELRRVTRCAAPVPAASATGDGATTGGASVRCLERWEAKQVVDVLPEATVHGQVSVELGACNEVVFRNRDVASEAAKSD